MPDTTVVMPAPTRIIKKTGKKISTELQVMHTFFAKYMAVMALKKKHIKRILYDETISIGEINKILNYVYNCIKAQKKLIAMEDAGLKGLQEDEKKMIDEVEMYRNEYIKVRRIVTLAKNEMKRQNLELWTISEIMHYLEQEEHEFKKTVSPASLTARTRKGITRAMEKFVRLCETEWMRSQELVMEVQIGAENLKRGFLD
ncbi:hypothetical protein JW707_01275 [Candidatus Woesearchaeota archaeon]|nr:hypothetical protein [Candidatus Woesearchaeota archaeon]